MNSIQISGNCENNVASIDESQCSGDLFQESPQFESNFQSNLTSDLKFSIEKSSETSDELCFAPRRKPPRALSFPSDSSHCYSKRSSDSLRNDSNANFSKFFQPISPACRISSSSLHEDDQSSSPKAYMTSGIHHLSKENVAVIPFVSESDNSDSSSILDDSLKYENEHQNSKQFFKTPLCNSVKKRTIRQWLNNVSVDCSLKPEENGPFNRREFILPQSNNSDHNDSKLINVNGCVSSSVDSNNAPVRTCDVEETVALNGSKARYSYDNDRFEKCNTTEYCPWLFDSFDNRRNENSGRLEEGHHIHESHECSREVKNHITIHPNKKSPNKFINFKPHYKLSKSLDKSLHEDSERNVSKRGNHLLSFNRSSSNHKSDDDNFTSADESDSTDNDISNRNRSKVVDSDEDSFAKVRLSRKKKNCLNISSDDSEAKDTANESEDISHHNNEPYTPRRRLYFRNPLNNSLDDDAKPLMDCKDDSKRLKDNIRFSGKKFDKSTGLLNQICSEVLNIDINNSVVVPVQNQSNSNYKYSDCGHDSVESDSIVPNKTYVRDTSLSFTQPATELNETVNSVSHFKSEIITLSNSSPREQDDVNQININAPKGNVSENNSDTHVNISNNEVNGLCPASFNESSFHEVLESSDQQPNELDDSSESVLNVKRKSKKNILDYSSDHSDQASEKPNPNIIDVNEISDSEPIPSKTKKNVSTGIIPLVDLTKSDEYDKYMYRTRSDSSFSDYEDITGISKDEVISVHTTTSEEGDDDENAPWFDLESYLKSNIPASSKTFDSSVLKNTEKRKARLAKISLPTHSTCPDHTSFLLSLTPEVPDEMCHPDAVKYRGESFSKHKNELVDLLFKLYNKEIFGEKLPPLEIKWSGHLTTTSGITKSSSKITKNGKIRNSVIKLSKTVVNDASKVRDVLLHELCHAANWLIDEQAGGHGPLFKKWVNKIWMKFPEVPKVKTTHHYELKWKYLYKCSFCGYELGKMKLTLNENSCRLCGGLVTVNT